MSVPTETAMCVATETALSVPTLRSSTERFSDNQDCVEVALAILSCDLVPPDRLIGCQLDDAYLFPSDDRHTQALIERHHKVFRGLL